MHTVLTRDYVTLQLRCLDLCTALAELFETLSAASCVLRINLQFTTPKSATVLERVAVCLKSGNDLRDRHEQVSQRCSCI